VLLRASRYACGTVSGSSGSRTTRACTGTPAVCSCRTSWPGCVRQGVERDGVAVRLLQLPAPVADLPAAVGPRVPVPPGRGRSAARRVPERPRRRRTIQGGHRHGAECGGPPVPRPRSPQRCSPGPQPAGARGGGAAGRAADRPGRSCSCGWSLPRPRRHIRPASGLRSRSLDGQRACSPSRPRRSTLPVSARASAPDVRRAPARRRRTAARTSPVDRWRCEPAAVGWRDLRERRACATPHHARDRSQRRGRQRPARRS